MLIYNCKLLFPKRFHSALSGETFDGPLLTFLRSGSEHQGAFFLFFPEGENTETRVSAFFNGKKVMPMSALKARFQIAECSSLYQQRRTG